MDLVLEEPITFVIPSFILSIDAFKFELFYSFPCICDYCKSKFANVLYCCINIPHPHQGYFNWCNWEFYGSSFQTVHFGSSSLFYNSPKHLSLCCPVLSLRFVAVIPAVSECVSILFDTNAVAQPHGCSGRDPSCSPSSLTSLHPSLALPAPAVPVLKAISAGISSLCSAKTLKGSLTLNRVRGTHC